MPDLPEPPPRPGAAPLGRIAGRGFLYLVVATGFGKCSALVGQIFLGWLLFPEDWGIYALTLSIAAVVQILRDAGVGQIIIQGGEGRYRRISGPAFWMALSFNLVAAGVLLAAAPVAASIYAQPDLQPMLWLVAAALVCGTPATVLRAKAQVELKFAMLGWIGAASPLVRWGCAVALAFAGFGPMSFMWAMLAATVFESLLLCAATGDQPWTRTPSIGTWPAILAKSAWVMAGSFASAVADRGSYLVLGLLISLPLLGQYSFGYELTIQLGTVLAFNMQSVLFPMLTRVVDDPDRLASGVERSLGVLFLTSSALAFLFAAMAEPLELLLWGGKWSDAVIAMQIFAIALPVKIMIAVPFAVLLAQGRFAAHAGLLGASAAVSICAAFLAPVLFGPTLGAIAATMGIGQAMFALVVSFAFLGGQGCDRRRLAGSLAGPWCIAGALFVGLWLLDQAYFSQSLPVVRLLLIGFFYLAAFGLLARLFMAGTLRQIADVMPAVIGRTIGVVMRLPGR